MKFEYVTSDPGVRLYNRNGNINEPFIIAGKNSHRFGFTIKAIEITGYKPGDKISIVKEIDTNKLFMFIDEQRGNIVKEWDKSNSKSIKGHKIISITDCFIRANLAIDKEKKVIFKILNSVTLNEKKMFVLQIC